MLARAYAWLVGIVAVGLALISANGGIYGSPDDFLYPVETTIAARGYSAAFLALAILALFGLALADSDAPSAGLAVGLATVGSLGVVLVIDGLRLGIVTAIILTLPFFPLVIGLLQGSRRSDLATFKTLTGLALIAGATGLLAANGAVDAGTRGLSIKEDVIARGVIAGLASLVAMASPFIPTLSTRWRTGLLLAGAVVGAALLDRHYIVQFVLFVGAGVLSWSLRDRRAPVRDLAGP